MKAGKVVHQFKSKKGREVVIRYLTIQDTDAMLNFANNLSAEDTFVLLSGEKLTKEDEERYVAEAIEKMNKEEKIHLVVMVDGGFAGNAEIKRFPRRKKHGGEISISLAAPFRDEGIGAQLLKTLIAEGKALGLQMLTLSCFENNDRAKHLYDKIGFRRAGNIPGVYLYKGQYIGEILYYLPLV